VAIPFFTKIIMTVSDLFVRYGIFLLILVIILVIYISNFARTPSGKMYFDRLKISLPIFRNIYTKLYLSRISDNMDTMLSSSIPIVRAIELTSAVVGNRVFEDILKDVAEAVKSGSSLSDAFSNDAVDTMVSLIEPIMIIILGLGVGILLSSILMPIYDIAGGVS
jgi:type IV pilus assembly protein PilC